MSKPAPVGVPAGGNAQEAPPAKKRKVKAADATVLVNGVMELLKGVLTELLNDKQVEDAIKKAAKHPDVKKMIELTKVKTKNGGPKNIRSNYVFFAALLGSMLSKETKEAHSFSISNSAAIWRNLPADLRATVDERLSSVRALYNEKVAAHQPADMVNSFKVWEAENKAEPINWDAMVQYSNGDVPPGIKKMGKKAKAAAEAAAAAAAAAGTASTPAAAAPARPAAAAAAPVAGGGGAPKVQQVEGGEVKRKHRDEAGSSHKKHKKEKHKDKEHKDKEHKDKKHKDKKKRKEAEAA